MATWQEDVTALQERMKTETSIATALGDIIATMSEHSDELKDVTAAYRFCPKESEAVGVRLTNGVVSPLDDSEAADVTVSGSGEAMLHVLSGTLNPLKAILLGKLKVKGNMALLVKLANMI